MAFTRTVALLAMVCVFAAVTAFGARGLVLGGAALAVTVFTARGLDTRARWRRAFIATFTLAGLALLALAFIPPVVGMETGGRVYWCKRNLLSIGIAMHNYHEKWEVFPPAYLADEGGQPAHSWRVLLLPFIEGGLFFRRSIAEQAVNRYDFAEPWDGPNNSQLMSVWFYKRHERSASRLYSCPASPEVDDDGVLTARYFAVIGEHTVWPGADSRSLSHIAVPSQTILVVECFDRAVPWIEPTDIALEEATVMPPVQVSFVLWWLGLTRRSRVAWDPLVGVYHRYMGRHALFADGTVRLLPNDLSAADFRALADIRDVPKPVLPPPPPDREAVPDMIRRLPFPPVAIRWTGFVLFLAALAAMARSVKPAPVPSAQENLSTVTRQAPP